MLRAVAGSRRRNLACALVIVGGLGASASAQAEPGVFEYCGVNVIGPNTWCTASQIHTYDSNSAYAKPRGLITIHQCSKLTRTNDSEWSYARRCDVSDWVVVWSDGGGKAPHPNTTVDMKAHVANGNSGSYVYEAGYGVFVA